MRLLEFPKDKQEQILKDILAYSRDIDYSKKNNLEIITDSWEIVCNRIGREDPYREVKNHYNLEIEKMSGDIKRAIETSGDKFVSAVKMAILGNLIDFAIESDFEWDALTRKIAGAENIQFTVDDSGKLYEGLKKAETLLYIGDNCGEIVFDKIFIEGIKKEFPGVSVSYAARGKPIANDVTMEDALMVGMDKIARVVDNGDSALGTIMYRVSAEFKKMFDEADIIISKGQANFESLFDLERGGIFFLFMAKCGIIAKLLGVDPLSILCLEKK
jgi:uncharacterized protein with ATP-grasp and redox domains